MRENVWRHRFVQRLFEVLRKETGLGEDRCYKLAFEGVDQYWGSFAMWETPEEAALAAYDTMRAPVTETHS